MFVCNCVWASPLAVVLGPSPSCAAFPLLWLPGVIWTYSSMCIRSRPNQRYGLWPERYGLGPESVIQIIMLCV